MFYMSALGRSGKWELWQKGRRQPNPLFRKWRMCHRNIGTSRMFSRKEARNNFQNTNHRTIRYYWNQVHNQHSNWFTPSWKRNMRHYRNILTRIWNKDILGHLLHLQDILYSLSLRRMGSYSSVWIIASLITSPSRTAICCRSFWSFRIDLGRPDTSPSWICVKATT